MNLCYNYVEVFTQKNFTCILLQAIYVYVCSVYSYTVCKCLICFRIERHTIIYFCRSNKALVLPRPELFAGE